MGKFAAKLHTVRIVNEKSSPGPILITPEGTTRPPDVTLQPGEFADMTIPDSMSALNITIPSLSKGKAP